MAMASELQPGDFVTLGERSAVFITQTVHPLWPHLQLVIWKLDNGAWSFDALMVSQDIGTIAPSSPVERAARLRQALLGR